MYLDIIDRLTWRVRKRKGTTHIKGCRKSIVDGKPFPQQRSNPKQEQIVTTTEVTNEPGKQNHQAPILTGEALLVSPDRTYKLDSAWPLPHIQDPKEVVIRVKAVGLNPIDWKSVEYNFCLPQLPWITGREASGVVESIGSAVIDIEIGERVWTSTYYRDIRAGCFQERIVVPAHTVLPIPSGTSFEQAATLGVAGVTAAMVLWKWLGVPMQKTTTMNRHDSSMELANPDTPCRMKHGYLLVWGGATVTGQYITQLATLSDIKTICVCSAATEALSYSLGATHVICRDTKSLDEIVEEARVIVGDKIELAVDLVGQETSAACLRAVSKLERVRFAPLAVPLHECDVADNVDILNVEMKQFVLDCRNRRFAEELNRLVGTKQIRCPELKVLEGDLRVVQDGLNMVKKGGLGGQKVVVRM